MEGRRPVVCLLAQTLGYPEGGGHFWCYYNWALGFDAAGFHVIWLEPVGDKFRATDALHRAVIALRRRLATEEAHFHIALCKEDGGPLAGLPELGALSLHECKDRADLFVNFRYGFPAAPVGAFRRSVLVDIDPGLLHHWVDNGYFTVAPHDVYVTVGGNIKPSNPLVPQLGLRWEQVRPAVHLPSWPVLPAPRDAAFTAISHWDAAEYITLRDGGFYDNSKRAGFEPLLDLPSHTPAALELALCFGRDNATETERLRSLGWRVVHSHDVSSTPGDYRRYIQGSAGEFGVAKPGYVKMDTGWISDRTVCYLASGRPCVVQDTGPVGLPTGDGLLRFTDTRGAACALERIAEAPAHHAASARQMAEEYFSAEKLARRVAELAL
ncbi:MAG: glycosyltransferase family 4 protein [Chthoniobacterales bacterium]|nr:glycosyltransferase family 4 protein [Chthoniobacterales bacterium]